MTFSSFHKGREAASASESVDYKGNITPNLHVRRQLWDDKEDPDAFKFAMNAEYRKTLMREFIREDNVPLHSRYSPHLQDGHVSSAAISVALFTSY